MKTPEPTPPRSKSHRSALASAIALGALALSATGCFWYPKGAAAPPPLSAGSVSAASARWPGTTAESLAAGRDLFLAKCNNCHDYPDLGSVAEDKWPGTIEKMGQKANLGNEQREQVLHFVLAARSEASEQPSQQKGH
ncbi:MAG TPA: hypothetical protein VGI39_23340 [Polyangiaceae bacterium]|jgi:cytochrome c5